MPHHLGPVGRSVQGLNARQRARVIARALAKHHNERLTVAAIWEVDGMAVRVQNVREVEGDLVMEVEVVNVITGRPVFFDNPLIIRNPRLLVPTAQVETVLDELGNVEQRAIFEEDLAEALRSMVLSTVRIVCRP